VLIVFVGVLARERPALLPGPLVKNREGQLAAPALVDGVDEVLIVAAALLVVVAKGRLLLGQEFFRRRERAGEVRRDPDDLQTSGAEPPLEPDEVGILLAAWLAPRGPEVDQDDLAPLASQQLRQLPGVHLTGESPCCRRPCGGPSRGRRGRSQKQKAERQNA